MSRIATLQIPLHHTRPDAGVVIGTASGGLAGIASDVTITTAGIYVTRHSDGLTVGVDLIGLCRSMAVATDTWAKERP